MRQQGCHDENAAIAISKSDPTEKRHHYETGRHFCRDHQGVLLFVDGASGADKIEGTFQFSLVERFGSEEVEIDRLTVAEMERDRRPSIKDKRKSRSGCELRPDFPLRLRQDRCLGVKAQVHRTISEVVPQVSPALTKATSARARIPKICR